MKRSACVFILVMLCGGFTIAVEAAQFLRADIALIGYGAHAFQARWLEGGAFSDVLQRDRQERQHVFLTGPKNAFIRYDLSEGVRKKGQLAFSPRVFIRPVIIVETLQALLITYQSQQTALVDGSALAKAIAPVGDMAQVRPVVTSPRIISFMPYYHKVYGVYVQILW